MSKILVIDDDHAFRKALAVMLERQGREVVQAATGAEGVRLARTDMPNLILCDVELGGVSGNLVLYAVRRDPQLASIPFVLMSGYGLGGETAVPGMKRGADAYLSKPFTPGALSSTIDACLRKWQSQTEAQALARSNELPAAGPSAGLLQPVERILQITQLLSAPGQLESKEIIGMVDQAHQEAAALFRRMQNCLFCAEIELLVSDWTQVGALLECRTGVREVIVPVAIEKARSVARTADLALNLEDARVAISSGRLKKIAEELLDNAFKYSQPGGAVHVKTAIDADHVCLSISDRGPGMAAEQIASAGAPISLDQVLLIQQGSGLGLFIAQRLTELHQGTFAIQSEAGHGTTVTVRLSKPSAP